jgi:hypothetical protein
MVEGFSCTSSSSHPIRGAREIAVLRCGTSLRKNLDDKYSPAVRVTVWLSPNPAQRQLWSVEPAHGCVCRHNGATILAIMRSHWCSSRYLLLVRAGGFVRPSPPTRTIGSTPSLHDRNWPAAATQNNREMARADAAVQEAYV